MELNIEKRWLEQFGLAPVRAKDARINELLHICNHNYDIDCSYFTEMVRHIRWLEEELEAVNKIVEKVYEEISKNSGRISKGTALKIFKYCNSELLKGGNDGI